jgi:hypothetical protein
MPSPQTPPERPLCPACDHFLPDNPDGLPDARARLLGFGGECAREPESVFVHPRHGCSHHQDFPAYARSRRDAEATAAFQATFERPAPEPRP